MAEDWSSDSKRHDLTLLVLGEPRESLRKKRPMDLPGSLEIITFAPESPGFFFFFFF